MKQYRKAILIALATFACILVMGAIRAVPKILQDRRNNAMIEAAANDRRSPEEAARDYLTYRAKVLPNAVGEITDIRVKAIANDATCLLGKMGITDKTYIQPDTRALATANIKHLKGSGLLGWLHASAEELLSEPLDCVKDGDGNCMKQPDGRACLLRASLASAVTKANSLMAKAGEGQIKPLNCYRSNLSEAVMYVANSGKGCDTTGAHPGLSLPGSSFHEMGLSIDLANSGQAKDVLLDVGMVCDFIPDDSGHCALGEASLSAIRLRIHAMRKTLNEFKEAYKEAKRIGAILGTDKDADAPPD